MKPKRSWREKLADNKGLPRVVEAGGGLAKRWGSGKMVIAAPKEVDKLMRKVPKGKLTTINDIRSALAVAYSADFACPVTTGIFAWIAANAAHEMAQEGEKKITPYWRTLKAGGELNAKYPGGIEALSKLLRKEGHEIVQKGSRYFVESFQEKLAPVGV